MKAAALVSSYFLFLFAPRLNVGVPLNLSLAALALLFLVRWKKLPQMLGSAELMLLATFFVAIALYNEFVAGFFGNDPTYFRKIAFSCVSYLVFGYLFVEPMSAKACSLEQAVERITRVFVFCVFLNSLLILLENAVPSVKQAVELLLWEETASSGLTYASHPFWTRGFTAAAGAGLSLANGLAVWACAALTILRLYPLVRGVIVMAVITTATIFVGRTGLIIAIVAMATFVIWQVLMGFIQGSRGRRSAFKILALGGLVALTAYRSVNLDAEVIAWAFDWFSGIQQGGSSSGSVQELQSMLVLPSNAWHLLFGMGFYEGYSPLYARTDSGYLKTLFSVGLLGGTLLYTVILFLVARLAMVSRPMFVLIMPMIVVMIVVEIKEPFLYQNFAARFLFSLIGASLMYASAHPLLGWAMAPPQRQNQSAG